MFLNSLKFNKNIIFKKYTKLFFNKEKITLHFSVFNKINTKPLNNFLYWTENFFYKNFFYKQLHMQKSTNLHMWWFFKPYKNYNFIFSPFSF